MSTRHELDLVLGSVPAGTPLLTVVLTCEVGTALGRVLADHSRGVSRQEGFLRRAHADWARQLPQIPADLVIDNGAVPLAEGVQQIRGALAERRER
ncbi:hypothetical protein [Brachybacterium sp.]|uniref:hypothetical protein n=1 Tax=Brachybacterium sp. TaxID=1891286 RepID=UPI003F8DAE58